MAEVRLERVMKAKKENLQKIERTFMNVCKKYNLRYSFGSEVTGLFKNKVIITTIFIGEEKDVLKAKREFDIWTNGSDFAKLASLLLD